MSQPDLNRSYLLFAVSLLWLMPLASAAPKDNADEVLVRSQLPLPGGPVQQMFYREFGGRAYLYISQANEPGYVVVDVTNDRHPKIIKEIVLPHEGEQEALEMVGAGLGVAGRPDNPPAQSAPAIQELSGNPSGQFMRLLDLSDPSHPRTLMTFDGVTSIVLDDRRNMIYLTNGEGLWILHHRVNELRQWCEEVSKYQSVPLMCTGY